MARDKLNPEQFAYVSAGAGDGDVILENRRALGRLRLIPRVMNPTKVDGLSTEFLGVKLAVPIILAPVRGLDYVRPKGQILSAQAAAKSKTPLMLSNLSSSSIEEVAKTLGETPRFMQLYPCTDDELVQSFLRRAELSGYSGVALTVDMGGNPIQYDGPSSSEYQNHGHEVYFSDPVFQSRLKQFAANDRKSAIELIRKLRDANFTWDEVEKVKSQTKLPVFLKGILSPEDAKEAKSRKVDGLVVSNHGGRSMGGEVASIDMLPEIIDATDGKMPVIYDGGVRSGIDVVKAVALGAKAAMIGRAYVYPLASAGMDGVEVMLNTMTREMKSTLATCGCSTVGDLNRSYVKHLS